MPGMRKKQSLKRCRPTHWGVMGSGGGVADQFRGSSRRRCTLKWISPRLPRNVGLAFAHSCTFTVYFQTEKSGEVGRKS